MPKIDRQALIYALNTFVASMLALYLAFRLDLERPYWAMMTVYITSSPLSAAVRSKAIYRLAGTLVGAGAAIAMVPNLVDTPLLLSFAIALWVAGCLVISLHDRTSRSYMTLLAGYTAAIIGFPAVSQPGAIFDIAVSRSEEIGIGIVSAALIHSLSFPRPVGDVIKARLSQWLDAADGWLSDILESPGAAAQNAQDRRSLAAAASDVRIMSAQLPFDTSSMRNGVAIVRAIHERMLLLIPTLSGLADRRQALAELGTMPASARERLNETSAWLKAGASRAGATVLAETLRAEATAMAGETWSALLLESFFARLADTVDALGTCHALLDHVRNPNQTMPADIAAAVAETSSHPLHTDTQLAVVSGATCIAAVMTVCVFWIATGWPEGATAASLTAVFCTLFANLDDPVPAVRGFTLASVPTLILGALYNFAILPGIDGFPLLATVLFPPLMLFGLGQAFPKTASIGGALAITFGNALGIREFLAGDFATYLNLNLGAYLAAYVAVFFIRTSRSMTATASAQRLLRITWDAIGRLAFRPAGPEATRFAARLVDRLALLSSRLAIHEVEGDAVAEDALRDLRVAMNVMSIREARISLRADDRPAIDRVMRGLGAHYTALSRGRVRPFSKALLRRLDLALRDACFRSEPRQIVRGLVGLRRNLFPAAPPFRAQEVPS